MRRATLPDSGAPAHFRALEGLYAAAPINRFFESTLDIPEPGVARIRFVIDERHFHAGGAAHGTSYFKMLDDAAFYACNSLVTDRFLLTTAFNLLFTRPLHAGPVLAEGRWISGQRRVFVGDARLINGAGQEVARGTGTFMRSRIPACGPAGLWCVMSDRLPTGITVSALLRRVNDDGGIGAVLAKGDPQAGAILVVIADRGEAPRLLERGFDRAGKLVLIDSTPTEANNSAADSYWKRRRERDPDLWVIELDSPSAERFAAETILGR